jgi:hypothetical protein
MHLFRDGMDIEFLHTNIVKYELNFKDEMQFAARRNVGEYNKKRHDIYGNIIKVLFTNWCTIELS